VVGPEEALRDPDRPLRVRACLLELPERPRIRMKSKQEFSNLQPCVKP